MVLKECKVFGDIMSVFSDDGVEKLNVNVNGFVRAGNTKLFRLGDDGLVYFWDKAERREVCVAVAEIARVLGLSEMWEARSGQLDIGV